MNHRLRRLEYLSSKFKRILVIPDMHHPYAHPDTVEFLKAIKDEYRPDFVVCTGDEVDNHAISFHDSDPNLRSPSDELEQAIEGLQPLYKLFPQMSLIDSNHGSLVYRKGRASGLPDSVFKSWNEILKAPKGWVWCSDIVINTELGPVYGHHGKSAASGKLSKNMAMSSFQGHYHSKFQIDYWGSPRGLFWDMHTGSLVDDHSLAMAYNKTTLDRPIVGAAMIVDGRPNLIPMHLARNGKWTRRI